MKQPIYVAFSTQKGGAGKTTLTVLVASYLHYVKDHKVAVIDCDYPQHSIYELRDRDFKMVETDEYYKGIPMSRLRGWAAKISILSLRVARRRR